MLSVIKHTGKQAVRQAGKEAGKPAGREARAIFKEVGAMPFGGLLFLELKGEGSRERAQERGLKREGSRESSREKAQERAQEAQERELKRSEPCPGGACSFWEMLLFKVLRKIFSLISGVFCVLKCLVLPFFLLFLLYK